MLRRSKAPSPRRLEGSVFTLMATEGMSRQEERELERELLDRVIEPKSERDQLWAMRDLGLISRAEHERHLRPLIAAEMARAKSGQSRQSR